VHATISPDRLQIVLLHILEQFRSTGGLNFSRLQFCGAESAAPLLDLAAVRRYSVVHDVALDAGALAVVGQTARELRPMDQIVVDAALGLGLLSDQYARSGISRLTIRQLADSELGRRRHALLENWQDLHEALADVSDALPIGAGPSESDLRRTIEPAALRSLARQLVRREHYSVGSANSSLSSSPGTDQEHAGRVRGRIIVVGAAVMDAVFRIRELPRWETSTEAHDFTFSPGGKGLTQAVAAARLGHRVSLVAAIADDRYGTEIVNYLRANDVDTSLLKIVPGAATPFTGVLEMSLGDSLATYWRNEHEVRLDPWDCDELVAELVGCDAVLMTFEAPRETVEHNLALLRDAGDARPLTIVTAAQPYAGATVTPDALGQIDYVVADPSELQHLRGTNPQQFDPDPAARELLERGVGSVCLLLRGGCTMYSQSAEDVAQAPVLASIYKESATARDAFCAALADELIQSGRRFSSRATNWASAAMSCAIADYPLRISLPSPERIETMLARFRSPV
jgi:ribokinase